MTMSSAATMPASFASYWCDELLRLPRWCRFRSRSACSSHNHALPGRQLLEPLAQCHQELFLHEVMAIAVKCELNRIEQILLTERFGQELHRARLHGPHLHRDVAGAILLQQNDEWTVQCARYMSPETIAPAKR